MCVCMCECVGVCVCVNKFDIVPSKFYFDEGTGEQPI